MEKQKAKRKFSEEIELRATPDTYLSEFDLIRKRYYEAKFSKMIKPMLNRKGIPMTIHQRTVVPFVHLIMDIGGTNYVEVGPPTLCSHIVTV